MLKQRDNDLSDLHVLPNGELGGKVPEELHVLANKESIGDYVKGMVLVALLLWGAAYMKQLSEVKAQKIIKELPAEQRVKMQQAKETYGGPGM